MSRANGACNHVFAHDGRKPYLFQCIFGSRIERIRLWPSFCCFLYAKLQSFLIGAGFFPVLFPNNVQQRLQTSHDLFSSASLSIVSTRLEYSYLQAVLPKVYACAMIMQLKFGSSSFFQQLHLPGGSLPKWDHCRKEHFAYIAGSMKPATS